ncbi:uncharacterized protein CXorf66 homolog [Talpa occidentalis]|uniref:uncharacterized protein CXorf66 homolog n=1 Tax=Talpa occidentalis TaxID=50954 RepID=UPI00188EE64E|nr:uncharacterized protein CXorf66 homolog [Talpa occidentalis]
MTLSIYVLFLSIWTYSCLTTNQTDEPPTIATRHTESMEMKMDSFRKRLLVIVIGIMIIAFVFTCSCFFHYNCTSEGETGKKENVTANPMKIPLTESKAISPVNAEKPLMLLGMDKLPVPSIAEKSSMHSSVEKTNRPASPEKSSIPSSAEKLIRHSSSEKSSIPSSGQKLIKPSSRAKSFKSPNHKKSYRGPQLDKKYRKHNVDKFYKKSHTYKPVSPCYPDKITRPLSPAKPTKPLGLPSPQDQTSPLKISNFQKLTKRPRNRNLKRPGSTHRTDTLFRPELAVSCQCYKENCLICSTLCEPLINDTSEAVKKDSQNLSFSSKVKSFSRPFHKVEFSDNAHMSDSDSNDDSEREITIICNIPHKEIIFKSTRNN